MSYLLPVTGHYLGLKYRPTQSPDTKQYSHLFPVLLNPDNMGVANVILLLYVVLGGVCVTENFRDIILDIWF